MCAHVVNSTQIQLRFKMSFHLYAHHARVGHQRISTAALVAQASKQIPAFVCVYTTYVIPISQTAFTNYILQRLLFLDNYIWRTDIRSYVTCVWLKWYVCFRVHIWLWFRLNGRAFKQTIRFSLAIDRNYGLTPVLWYHINVNARTPL